MRVGIIGAGRIAEKMAAAVNNVEGAELYSISSRTLTKARSFAEKFGAKIWYEGTDEFLKDPKLDVVYVATPHSLHKKYSIESIKNKKAVLCEKPLTLNIEEAEELINVAKDEKVLLVEAMWTKHFPAVKRVKEILESGALGDIETIQGDLSFCLGRDKERIYRKDQGGGALLDLGVYPITMAHYFLGKPDRIVADSHFTEEGIDQSTSMIFSYNSGAKALLTCSVAAKSTNEFVICCSKGWIRLNGEFHHPTSISAFFEGVGEQHQEFPWDTDGYEYQVKQLMEDFNNGLTESSVVKFDDTLEIMALMDEVREITGLSFNE